MIGFSRKDKITASERDELLKHLNPKDLIEFGMIPEFVGRLPVITTLEELGAEDLVRVLTEPRNALVKQYEAIFHMEDCELAIEEEALKAIAAIALKRETGVRALRTIFEDLLRDALYDLPSKPEKGRYVITPEYVGRPAR